MKRKRNTNAPSTPSLEVSGFRSPSDFKLEDEGPLSFNVTNVGVDLSSGSFNAADITVLAAVERGCYPSRTQPHSVCVQALLRLQNQHITNGKHMCDPSCLLTTYSTCLSLRSSTALLSDRHSSHLDFSFYQSAFLTLPFIFTYSIPRQLYHVQLTQFHFLLTLTCAYLPHIQYILVLVLFSLHLLFLDPLHCPEY